MGKKISDKTAKKMVEKKINFKPIMITTIAILLVIALIVSISVNSNKEETYVTVGKTELTETEYSFYYTLTVNNYLYQYDGYLEYIGLDTSKPYSEQYIDETRTWEDFFKDTTNSLLQSSFALYEDAKNNKYDGKNNSFYLNFIDSIKTAAKNNNTTYSQYLKTMFGENMTVNIFEKQLDIYSTSIVYSEYLIENFKDSIDEKQINEIYQLNPNNYDRAEYYIFALPYSKDIKEDDWKNEKITEETALSICEKVKSAQNLEDFIKLSSENCFESYKDAYKEENLEPSFSLSKNNLNVSLQEWVYSNDRQYGDITLINDRDTSSAIVLFFIDKKLDERNTVDFRYITLTLETYETAENLKKQAEGMYNLWITEGATEEKFIEYANLYSENSANKGLCESVYIGELDKNIENWLFDKSRKTGDHNIFNINSDYHLFYYIGTNEPYYYSVIRNEFADENYDKYMHSILDKYKLIFADGNSYNTMDSHSEHINNTEIKENTENN